METKTVNSNKVQKGANYVMLFLSTFGLGYSIMKYFTLTENEANWSTIAPLFIISIVVFFSTVRNLRKNNL